jgi:acyl-CoA-binding protein
MSLKSSSFSLTIALGVVSVVAATAWYWARESQQKDAGVDNNNNNNNNDESPVSPAVQATFEECAVRIRKITTDISDGDKLFLYALYKQGTVGNAPASFVQATASSSSWNVVAAQAKYAAWCKLLGMPRMAAIFQYIATVEIHLDEAALLQDDEDDDEEDDDTEPVNNTTPNGGGSLLAVSVSRPVEIDLASTTTNGDEGDDSVAAQFLRAAAADNLADVAYLVERQTMDINHQDDVGQTALHLAADHGAVRVLQYLLAHAHIHVNAADEQGISVLQAAVIAGQVKACRLLLQAGADPDQADEDGDTPRHCAADDGAEELRRLFP